MLMWDNVAVGKYWDKPLGLVSSCTRCSEGCRSCWALATEKRFHKGVEGKIILHPEALKKLNRKKPTVFAVWNDWLHKDVPGWLVKTFIEAVAYHPQHTVLALTKRAERLPLIDVCNTLNVAYPPNLWLGVTVESAKHLDRIEYLRQTPAAVRFISFEPLLSEIPQIDWTGISWAIIGCESGPNRRTCDVRWMTGLIAQVHKAGVAVFVKQVDMLVDDKRVVSKDMSEWPASLGVRKWPV
jgi:protein gp37